MYLYCAVDSKGNTIDFYLSQSRDKQAAKHFFKKALAFSCVSKSRVITVDKNPTYPVMIHELKKEKHMSEGIQLGQARNLNIRVEQDYRFIKKRAHSMLGFNVFKTAISILSGVESIQVTK